MKLDAIESNWSQVWQFKVKLTDLSIAQADISFEPANIMPIGRKVFINATIHNIGEVDAENIYIEFYDLARNLVIGNCSLTRIEKGKSAVASITYTSYEVRDWFTIRVIVDPHNLLAEIARNNNIADALLKIIKYPDAYIVNISVEVEGKVQIFDNDTVKITARISNIGGEIPKEMPFYVEFWLGKFENGVFNGSLLEIKEVSGLASDKEIDVSVMWVAKVGNYTVMIALNTTKVLLENLDGNIGYKNFTVFSTPVIPPAPTPFPWYLVLIAIVITGIAITIALLAMKGIVVIKPAKPRKAEKGYNYLVKDTDTRRAYEIFSNFAKELQLLCLTSIMPRKVISLYPKLEKCEFYWLSDITTREERTLHPERLEFEITKTIIEFVRATKGVVMIDGLEYLIQNNGLERTLEFLHSTKDIISTNNGTLIVPINSAVFKEEDLASIEKVFDRVI
jgi:hypothetical protein